LLGDRWAGCSTTIHLYVVASLPSDRLRHETSRGDACPVRAADPLPGGRKRRRSAPPGASKEGRRGSCSPSRGALLGASAAPDDRRAFPLGALSAKQTSFPYLEGGARGGTRKSRERRRVSPARAGPLFADSCAGIWIRGHRKGAGLPPPVPSESLARAPVRLDPARKGKAATGRVSLSPALSDVTPQATPPDLSRNRNASPRTLPSPIWTQNRVAFTVCTILHFTGLFQSRTSGPRSRLMPWPSRRFRRHGRESNAKDSRGATVSGRKRSHGGCPENVAAVSWPNRVGGHRQPGGGGGGERAYATRGAEPTLSTAVGRRGCPARADGVGGRRRRGRLRARHHAVRRQLRGRPRTLLEETAEGGAAATAAERLESKASWISRGRGAGGRACAAAATAATAAATTTPHPRPPPPRARGRRTTSLGALDPSRSSGRSRSSTLPTQSPGRPRTHRPRRDSSDPGCDAGKSPFHGQLHGHLDRGLDPARKRKTATGRVALSLSLSLSSVHALLLTHMKDD
jgi:hypothetical protein